MILKIGTNFFFTTILLLEKNDFALLFWSAMITLRKFADLIFQRQFSGINFSLVKGQN